MNGSITDRQIARISEYEGIMDDAQALLNAGNMSRELVDLMRALEAYYTSAEWKRDFADDETGKLPKDLKRGVLSEDGIDRLLEAFRELAESKRTVLETERLTLHVASQEEMTDFIERQTDGDLKTAYKEMLQGCLEHPEQWEWYAIWMIELKNGAHVGDLSFKGLAPDGSAEIGYGILEAFRGRGYATEAVQAAVDWALEHAGVSRIEAETEPDNMASRGVLLKCGFFPSGQRGEEGPRFLKLR